MENITYKDVLMSALEDNECLIADGFDDALIGISAGMNPVAVYDHDLCVDILMKGGMTDEDAVEHMNFNVTGAYVGDKTPVFVYTNTE
tara:strand:+ start:197 stop:460 length:264 start_codon:yes stop_codon:yes gene_type:complete